jgi:hypothetical protein
MAAWSILTCVLTHSIGKTDRQRENNSLAPNIVTESRVRPRSDLRTLRQVPRCGALGLVKEVFHADIQFGGISEPAAVLDTPKTACQHS